MPVISNVYISLTNWKKFKGFDEFVAFKHYVRLLSGDIFFEAALVNTVIWVVASLTLPLIIGFVIAAVINNVKNSELVKNIIFLPKVLAPTAVGLFWFYMYAPDGVVNQLLGLFSKEEVSIGFLYQDSTITPSVIAVFVWQTVGFVMVLILLGLAALPKDPLEAAKMDGASRSQVFVYVVLPLLAPTLLMVAVLSVLAGFTTFDLLYVMGESHPSRKTLSLAMQMYFEAFNQSNWARGSSIAVIIGFTVLGFTWIQIWLQRRIEKSIR